MHVHELYINILVSQIVILKARFINPLPYDKILDWSKLKQFTDDILKCIQNEKKVPYRVENIVRKGEIACYKQCFPQLYIFSASKCSIAW